MVTTYIYYAMMISEAFHVLAHIKVFRRVDPPRGR